MISTVVDKKKKQPKSSSCFYCGIFTNHTKRGHNKKMLEIFSLGLGHLPEYVRSNIIATNNVLSCLDAPDADALLNSPPVQYNKHSTPITGVAGRNFVALLLQERVVIMNGRLCWETVFEWACKISCGQIIYEIGKLPDAISASNFARQEAKSLGPIAQAAKHGVPDHEDDDEDVDQGKVAPVLLECSS